MVFSVQIRLAILPTAALCALACAGCRTTMGKGPVTVHFPDPESFVVEADTAKWPRPARRDAPRYPLGPRQRGESALVIVALIIDSAGVVERPSLTLLSPRNPDFDSVVCTYLGHARFQWQVGQSHRTLVVVPFYFAVGGPGPLPPASAYVDVALQFKAIPRQELVQRLEAERHCA